MHNSTRSCERCGDVLAMVRGRSARWCRPCAAIVHKDGNPQRKCPLWGAAKRGPKQSEWVRVAHPQPTDACGRRWCMACGATLVDGGRNYHLKRTCSPSCQQVCNRLGWSLKADRVCRACSMPFTTDVGKNHQHCSRPDCVSTRRDAARTGTTVACRVCGVLFQRTAKSESCSPEHAKELLRERNRRKNRKRRNARMAVAISERYSVTEIANRDACRCHLCGHRVNMDLSGMHLRGPTIDHLVPLSCGGDDIRSNVALAHRDCNTRRSVGGFAQLRLAVG